MPTHEQSATANQPPLPVASTGHRVVASIVGSLAILLGVLAAIGNALLLAVRIYGDGDVPWEDVPWAFRFWEIELRVVAVLIGLAFVFGGLRIMQRRWIAGSVTIGLAVLMIGLNQPLNRTLRHLTAGDGYDIPNRNSVLSYDPNLPPPVAPQEAAAPHGVPELSDDALDEALQGETVQVRRQGQWSARVHESLLTTNSVGMNLVLIPPGSFVMGSSESLHQLTGSFPVVEASARDPSVRQLIESEQPQHKVRLRRPFYIGQHNVTYGQFTKFTERTGYKTEAERDGKGGWGLVTRIPPKFVIDPQFNWRNTGFEQDENAPVVNISWADAVAYCQWLSKLESKSYRLPTEAEWEYACRAGTTTRFQNGDDPSCLLTVANVSDIAYVRLLAGGNAPAEAVERGIALGVIVGGDDHSTFTSPVGRFKPNGFGVQDMHGNAATWCADWYDPNYYATSGTNDPTGPASGRLRAVRGGSWQFYPHMCRSASRNACAPLRRETFLGMRVVREIDYPSGTR